MSDKRLRNIQAALVGCSTNDTYSDDVKNLFQDKVDAEYYYASDVYPISKLNTITNIYEDLKLRLVPSYTISQTSSLKDDFRTIIFPKYFDDPQLGDMYKLSNYYWMTLDSGKTKVSSSSCQIMRCNDSLRFFDDDGIYHNLPCITFKTGMYDLNEDTILNMPQNQVKVKVRWDSESQKIKWADMNNPVSKYTRFILQNKIYRVTSTDPHSYVRNLADQISGVGFCELRLQEDQFRESDDRINQIADGLSNNIVIDILNGDSTVTIGQTLQLNTLVTKNNVAIDNPVVTYTSATPTIASVNPSGLVTAIVSGNTSISATYGTVSDSVLISATPVVSNNYTIDFSSSTGILDSVKLGQSIVYNVTFKNNGTSYVDSATFSLTDDTGLAPTSMVSILSQTGTSCTIKASSVSANVGQYVRLYAVGTNKTEYIRLLIKSIF